MSYTTKVFITDIDMSLVEACRQYKDDIVKSIPNNKFVSFKYTSNISAKYNEAIIIDAYPSLNSYHFVKNQNSEYFLIFNPIATLNALKKNNKICKKTITRITNLYRQNKILEIDKLNIQINVLIVVIFIIIFLHLSPKISTSWQLSPFFNNIINIFIHRYGV